MDTETDTAPASEGRRGNSPHEDDEVADGTFGQKPEGLPSKEPRDLFPVVLEPPRNTEGIELVIRSNSKTVVDWINGQTKQTTTVDAIGAAQKELRDCWGRSADLRRRVDDWAVDICSRAQLKSRPLGGKGSERPTRRMGG